MNNDTKICEFCGKEFEQRQHNQITCGSKECKRKNKLRHMSRYRNKRGVHDQAEANELRVSMGMRPIEKDLIPCLRCERMFFSEDTVNNRICYYCSTLDTLETDIISDANLDNEYMIESWEEEIT